MFTEALVRDYGRVSPQFWMGRTGRQIKAKGALTQLVALYLMTAPGSSMIGLFYCPASTIAHEVGCPLEGACKALRSLAEVGFAEYDEAHEVVWVREMAAHQIAETVKRADKRHYAIVKEAEKLSYSSVYAGWFERYRTPFNLPDAKPLRSPLQGACKALPSQEQEQEQEKEQDQDQDQEVSEPPKAPRGGAPVPTPAKAARKSRKATPAALPLLGPKSEPEPVAEPLPFTVEAALDAIGDASNGRFSVPRGGEFDGRYVKPLVAMIRAIPDLGAWSRVGFWLAAGAEDFRGVVSVAWITMNRDAFAKARAWAENGGTHSREPVSAEDAAYDAAWARASAEYDARIAAEQTALANGTPTGVANGAGRGH
jgi:hypothetical protein